MCINTSLTLNPIVKLHYMLTRSVNYYGLEDREEMKHNMWGLGTFAWMGTYKQIWRANKAWSRNNFNMHSWITGFITTNDASCELCFSPYIYTSWLCNHIYKIILKAKLLMFCSVAARGTFSTHISLDAAQ